MLDRTRPKSSTQHKFKSLNGICQSASHCRYLFFKGSKQAKFIIIVIQTFCVRMYELLVRPVCPVTSWRFLELDPWFDAVVG